MVAHFSLASTPRIVFGSGKLKSLPRELLEFGNRVLLVTGSKSFIQSDHWDKLLLQFETAKITWRHHIVDREPTPELVDNCVSTFAEDQFDAIVAVGGGSVVDAGKAISAMFCQEGSVRRFLEGVGDRMPSGEKIPFIAAPTTAGTGSESTKNAVISEVGINGFKRSIRHDHYVPDIALVDPELTRTCPFHITAQSGMDAFTQLLESYVSTGANRMTDALAVDGLRSIRDGLLPVARNGEDLPAREHMAYAAMLSGITLANAGLGTVHGFASSIGGMIDVPHGLVCARMMAPVNRINIEKLKTSDPRGKAMLKYARAGKLFSNDKHASDKYYVDLLLDTIESYSAELEIDGLAGFGLMKSQFEEIAARTGNKNNPVILEREELIEVLEHAM